LALSCVTIAVVHMALATSAQASPLTFFGNDQGVFFQSGAPTGAGFPNALAARTSFLANLTGVGTETFESFADGTGGPLALTFPGAGTATLTGSGNIDDDPGTGQNATSGNKWWRTGVGNDFSVTFSAPVAAFGFYGIDVGDINSRLTLTLANGGTVVLPIPHPLGDPQNGSVFFFGYIDASNPWTSAAFSNPASGDDFGFDDMTIGSVEQVTPVPEPSTLAALGFGALGLALVRGIARRTSRSRASR
jgi:hypothetical protein